MRYLYLALAALSGSAFAMLQIPQSHVDIRFLSSLINLPSNSLATLSFVLGAVSGAFLALFVSSLARSRGLLGHAVGIHTRAGA